MSFITNAIGDILGTNQQASAAQQAAQTQSNAQLQAQQLLQQNLAPYSSIGTSVLPQLLTSLGYNGTYGSNGNLTGISGQGFQFNPSNLASTPGYQFTLQQGLKGINNQASATGLNQSGAQQKGIANYTTGLAQNTYNQQYANALSTYMTNAGQLGSLLNLGQNAAAGVGQGAYNSTTAAGNAIAQGQIAGGQSGTNAIQGALGLGLGGAGIYSLLAGSGGAAAAGGAAASASSLIPTALEILGSDSRIKQNIKFLGVNEKGIRIYEYEYKPKFHKKWGIGKFIGAMAQEVEKIMPEAVLSDSNGYKLINYALLG